MVWVPEDPDAPSLRSPPALLAGRSAERRRRGPRFPWLLHIRGRAVGPLRGMVGWRASNPSHREGEGAWRPPLETALPVCPDAFRYRSRRLWSLPEEARAWRTRLHLRGGKQVEAPAGTLPARPPVAAPDGLSTAVSPWKCPPTWVPPGIPSRDAAHGWSCSTFATKRAGVKRFLILMKWSRHHLLSCLGRRTPPKPKRLRGQVQKALPELCVESAGAR